MSFCHSGQKPVELRHAPIDPDSTDWVFFSYTNWLRATESIDAHAAVIVGGAIVTDSVYIGTVTMADGTSYDDAYGVQFSVTSGATEVRVTHRKTTSTTDSPSLARVDIDHTVVVPVEDL